MTHFNMNSCKIYPIKLLLFDEIEVMVKQHYTLISRLKI